MDTSIHQRPCLYTQDFQCLRRFQNKLFQLAPSHPLTKETTIPTSITVHYISLSFISCRQYQITYEPLLCDLVLPVFTFIGRVMCLHYWTCFLVFWPFGHLFSETECSHWTAKLSGNELQVSSCLSAYPAPLLQHKNYRHVPSCLAFCIGGRDQNSGPHV